MMIVIILFFRIQDFAEFCLRGFPMCVLPFLFFFVLFHFRVPNICVKNKQNKKRKLYVDDLLVSVTFVTWEDYSEDFFSSRILKQTCFSFIYLNSLDSESSWLSETVQLHRRLSFTSDDSLSFV